MPKTRYYMITITKCNTKSNIAPTKTDFKSILYDFKKTLYFNLENIFCYEFKANKWIHYHGIISHTVFLKYTDFKKLGYSIKVEYLRTVNDLLNAVRYINKQKIDKVDCQLDNSIFINTLSDIYQ